ncbi:ankyrin repeat-containing domain protein [Microdochium bolleyi]|uniref:Ankyrin repeat-containing domain protein n=1 Tax=Microdochium bolleyi TaxID=196109 RepID=A0A136IMP2_9PEZI|nr:ankyrin repeat-containing domain protein [Microdochium bolleyi]
MDRVHHLLAPGLVHKPLAATYPHLLVWAAHAGYIDLIRHLLAAGADPNICFRRWAVIDRDFAHPEDILDKLYNHQVTSGTLKRRTELRKKTAEHFARFYNDAVYNQTYTSACLIGEPFEPNSWDLTRWQEPDLADRSWWYPLHAAASAGHNDIVMLLVKHGAHLEAPAVGLCDCTHPCSPVQREHHESVEWQDQVSWSPLHVALCGGHDTTAQLLLSLGASTSVDCLQSTPTALFSAVRHGCAATVQQLLDADPSDVNSRDQYGLTPLFHCLVGSHGSHAEERHEQVARLLLQYGADPEVDLGGGCTLLHAACLYGWSGPAQRVLIAHYADLGPIWRGIPGFPDHAFRPIEFAAWLVEGYDEQHHQLFRGHDLGTARPGPTGDPRSVVDIPFETAQQEACLELWCHRNELMRLLFQHGGVAIANPRTHSTYTALIAAISTGSCSTVTRLVNTYGVSVHDTNNSGMFPLLAAVTLREERPWININPTDGTDSVKRKNDRYLRIVKCLLKGGADVNQRTQSGTTALLAACQAPSDTLACLQSWPIISEMLSAGADMHMGDNSGLQPLDAALQARNLHTATRLIQSGAQLNQTTRRFVEYAKELLHNAVTRLPPCVRKNCTCTPGVYSLVTFGSLVIFRHLLQRDVRHSILSEPTCFWLASLCPHLPFARLMFEHGRPNISGRGKFKRGTCLSNITRAFNENCEASRSAILPLIPLLRLSGADFDLASPVWHALSGKKWTVARALLDDGAMMTRHYMNSKSQGDVILQLIQGQRSRIVHELMRFIIARMAPQFTTAELNLYLYEACAHLHLTIIDILLASGAQRDAVPPPANLRGDSWPTGSTPASILKRSWSHNLMEEGILSPTMERHYNAILGLLRSERSSSSCSVQSTRGNDRV